MDLIAVNSEDRELLWNINQKYLYEMTNYYDDVMDSVGVLHYGYFDSYFTDPNRIAFFICEGEALVGFAMIHPYSQLETEADYVLAEFTIFPMYRRRRFAERAAYMLFDMFRGRWEVKYNEKNTAAKALWHKVTGRYFPKKTFLNEYETVLSFCTE
ncbi:MAG: GNAT family N-acetyltransferase [Clostridia bacterium]|nr:GNAT family N-acetyltransferase [Clostridia bacterium]